MQGKPGNLRLYEPVLQNQLLALLGSYYCWKMGMPYSFANRKLNAYLAAMFNETIRKVATSDIQMVTSAFARNF